MLLHTDQVVILLDWIGVVPGMVFVLLYAIVDRWRYTVYGRHMMSFVASITIILSLSIYHYYLPGTGVLPASLQYIRYAVGINFIYLMWRNLYLFVRAQIGRTSEQTSVKPQERVTEYE